MIRERDMWIDVYRSNAVLLGVNDAWGVWVRVTHVPSGLFATGRHRHSSRIAHAAAVEELEERLAERFCPRHYNPDALFNFTKFRRWGSSSPCPDCVEEERQAWLAEVRCKFQRGLEAAARGEQISW